ncbi:hypothetical protein [Streptomyces sp. NPDC051909]|uniref:hypothetical protein n=1 Tax=Streptomyces sp. NPDC051909 TaxID=3154944 RepID=UPI00341D09B2
MNGDIPTLSFRERAVSTIRSNSGSEWYEDVSAAGADSTCVEILRADKVMASAVVERAEHCTFGQNSGVRPEQLRQSIAIRRVRVAEDAPQAAFPAILYLALRRGRIWGRHTAVAQVAPRTAAGLGAVLGFTPLSRATSPPGYTAVWHRVDQAAHTAFEAAADQELRQCLKSGFVPELVEVLHRWLPSYYATPFFESIRSGTLAKEQYIYAMSNIHQFVRWTTRLIARAVSHSHGRNLRDHWLNHLKGEINHERIIESDLAALGADVQFVTSDMVPCPSVFQFMAGQQSSSGFEQDPVLLMASPLVAEGLSANMDEDLIAQLHVQAAAWGIDHPPSVTRFLSSHIGFDGGDDGHWARTCNMLEQCLTDDAELQKFLVVMRLSMSAFHDAFTDFIDHLSLHTR